MTVGLLRSSLNQYIPLLRQLQTTVDLLSDPHQVSIDPYFHFLVVEAKGMATITSAENQAAVDGACAINVLRQLQHLVGRYLELFPNSDTPPTPPLFIFFITTEWKNLKCAHHDLWVHYYSNNAFHMTIKCWFVERFTAYRCCGVCVCTCKDPNLGHGGILQGYKF